jgi:hypothetical protein
VREERREVLADDEQPVSEVTARPVSGVTLFLFFGDWALSGGDAVRLLGCSDRREGDTVRFDGDALHDSAKR